MSYLRKIDPNVRISWSTGIVTTTKNNTPGSKLISGLQLSNNTVTIQKGNTSHKPESHENSAVAGVGTDSIVYFSSDNIQEGNYYLKDNSGNFYIAGSQPLEIVLGHELIHGLHAAEGTRDISWDDYAYPIDGNYDGRHQSGDTVLSRSTGTGFPREEAKTIGVGEYRDNEITENALRKQRGYDERVNH